MLAANWAPKMCELEIIAPIGGHCPDCIQRALLSANVQTIEEPLSFLNAMQIMEDGQRKQFEPPKSRPENSPSPGATDRGINQEYQLGTLQRYLQL
jgi:hypothetical protein